MAENVFEAVKQSVSTRDAAAFYGIEVKRNGMACCPFHEDKNPSMKVDQRFHCFGCGEDGDVIDFIAKLFDLSPKEAAEKLAQDFGLIYDSQAPPRRRYVRQKTEAQKFREDRQRCYRVLSDYYYLLKKWEADNSPRTPEEEPHPRFVEAIQKKTYVEYLLDLFLYESEEEQKAWIAEHTAEITHLERRLKIMAENKPTNRERLREITDGIEQGIKELFESEKYMRYLSVMSRFHRYSVNNTMLIYMQKPDATLVAGYNKWKDQFERHVKKGEHGITIIAPTPYKKKIEEQKLDPDTKAPILDKDGKIVTEEKEIEIPMFRPVKVFDVSQTDGKPLPELASSLSGNVPNYEAFMEALRRSAPVPITFESMAADTDGYFSADHQKIAIRQGMSEVQTVSATVHEIAHSKLHNQKKIQIANDEQYQEIELFDKPGLFSNGRIVRDNLPEGVYCYDLRGSDYDPGEPVCVEEQVVVNHAGSVLLTEPLELAEDGRLMLTEEEGLNFVGGFSTLTQFFQEHRKDRHTEEVEAESISYAVCKYFGIETGENSFGYIASWSQGKELKELRASLETINKTSGTLISDIERHYKEICKERGIDPHAKAEPETAPIEQPTGNLTYYVAECMEFPNLGEYHDNLSLEEAVRIYQEIPAERMNGIKGIGFELKDGSDYEGPFPILTGQTIDLDTIQAIDYYRDNPLVQKAVKELAAAMQEMEALGWLINNSRPNTANAPDLISALLGWETMRSWNIGFDLGMLNNRLTVSFDWFNRKTINMVGPAPELPVTLGANVPKMNNADMQSTGFELDLGWRDRIKDFDYSVHLLLSDDRQKILKYPNTTGKINTWYVGKYNGDIWGFETIGIAKSQEEMDAHLASLPNGGQDALGVKWGAGDIMYRDLNGDGKISDGATLNDPGDKKVIGNTSPRFRFGLDLNASWKGIDVRLFFQGVAKRDAWLNDNMFWGATGGIWQSACFTSHLDFFREEGDDFWSANKDAYFPRILVDNFAKNQKTQTRYLQNAAYVRLKNLQIGYTIPAQITRKIGVSNLRVFFSGENLFTLTGLPGGFDPETINTGYGAKDGSNSSGKTYPLSRTFSTGFSVNF